MKRRRFLGLALAAVLVAPVAGAQNLTETILSQLRRQGFRDISVARTMLGRTRIVATNSKGRREIILNPRTGEILRDFWLPSQGSSSGGNGLIDNRSGGGGNNDDDDDDDDDNGSGSGGSGGNDDDDDDSGGGSDSDDDDD